MTSLRNEPNSFAERPARARASAARRLHMPALRSSLLIMVLVCVVPAWLVMAVAFTALVDATQPAGWRVPFLLLCAAALSLAGVAVAWGIARRIAASTRALLEPASQLSRGEPVNITPLALPEAQVVAQALTQASRVICRQAREREAALAVGIGLAHEASHDVLTGLSNRRAFMDRLATCVARDRGLPARFAVLFLDIDDFKLVNDDHGHAAGDRLLQAVAARMEGGIRETDLAARLGGDEFAILLDEIEAASALSISLMLGARLARPYGVGDSVLQVSASIGLAIDGSVRRELTAGTPEHWLAAADRAMYTAKKRGKGRLSVAAAADHTGPHFAQGYCIDLRHLPTWAMSTG